MMKSHFEGDVRALAVEKFGQINARLSSTNQLRFGSQGSKSVEVDTGAWFDFEVGEGGYLTENIEQPTVRWPRMIVKKYDYHNADGQLHMQVCRFLPKDFRPRRPDPNNTDKWIWSIKGVETVPYRLNELIASDYVVIVEGEKDADRLAELGIVATTNMQGAGNWQAELSKYFEGKRVYIIPDNDKAGSDRTPKIIEALHPVAQSIRVCDVCAGMPAKSDVSDYLDAGNEISIEKLNSYAIIQDPIIDIIDESNVFELINADQITASLATDDFVENLLISGAMSVVYGPSNCGKTFFASDLALHVAIGARWRDREIEQGGVIYIAAEGAHGIKNRVAAFKQKHGIVDGIPFGVLPTSVNMSDPEGDIDTLINTVRLAKKNYGRVALVVIDTLARVMVGNENAAEDMNAVIKNADRLRQVTNAHVMLIHHSGKSKEAGARGSSALRAATDTEIEIEKSNNVSTATVSKQREIECEGEFHFGLEVIELGHNQRGKAVTSCVVTEEDAPGGRKRERRPNGKQQKLLFNVAQQLLSGAPSRQVLGANGPTVRVIVESELRNSTYARMTNDPKHKSTAFNRALDGLVADEFLMRDETHIWAISDV